MSASWTSALADLLFPPRCSACEWLGRAPFCRYCQEALLEPDESLELPFPAQAAFVYGGPMELAITRFKHSEPSFGLALGQLLRPWLVKTQFDCIVPVPPSSSRLMKRGFSPPRELVRGFPKLAPAAVRRTEDRPPQAGLGRRQRLKNQEGAFQARPEMVRGRRVVLVDDVVTTGATLRAAASALFDAGATSVQAWALAQASLDRA